MGATCLSMHRSVCYAEVLCVHVLMHVTIDVHIYVMASSI